MGLFANTLEQPKGPYLTQFEADELAESSTGTKKAPCFMEIKLGSVESLLVEHFQSFQFAETMEAEAPGVLSLLLMVQSERLKRSQPPSQQEGPSG